MLNKKKITTTLVASVMAVGIVGTSVAPSLAIGGQEGTVYGQVTPGTAVWGISQNDYLGSFKIPTTDGLDEGVFLDAKAENPRSEFNTLVTYDSQETLNTDSKVSGDNVSKEGLRQIIGAISIGKDISANKGVSNEIKDLLKSYGYTGDYGQKLGLQTEGLTDKIAQNATNGKDGDKIIMTQGDYVMMAVSAVAYNGANPGQFSIPVSTQSISGNFDEGTGAGMTDDFNSLVSALQAMSASIDDEIVNAAQVKTLTYNGNDEGGNGEPTYRRALSFTQSVVLDVKDIPQGTQEKAPETTTVTTEPTESASPSATPSTEATQSYDPTGTASSEPTDVETEKPSESSQESPKADAKEEPTESTSPTPTPSDSTTSEATQDASPVASDNPSASTPASSPTNEPAVVPVSNEGNVTSYESVTPTTFRTGASAGAVDNNDTAQRVSAIALFAMVATAVGTVVVRRNRQKA